MHILCVWCISIWIISIAYMYLYIYTSYIDIYINRFYGDDNEWFLNIPYIPNKMFLFVVIYKYSSKDIYIYTHMSGNGEGSAQTIISVKYTNVYPHIRNNYLLIHMIITWYLYIYYIRHWRVSQSLPLPVSVCEVRQWTEPDWSHRMSQVRQWTDRQIKDSLWRKSVSLCLCLGTGQSQLYRSDGINA